MTLVLSAAITANGTYPSSSGVTYTGPTTDQAVVVFRGTLASATGVLEVSFDGGTTWQEVGDALGNAVSLSTNRPYRMMIITGAKYRLTISNSTGSTSFAASIEHG